MSLRKAIQSALHLFVVLALFTVALFFVLLPSLPLTRMEIIDFLTNRYEQCGQIGLGIFLVATLFLLGFYSFNRGKYLSIRMGISVDIKTIRRSVEDCFNKHFPKKISLQEVEIGPKQCLHFTVRLAPADEAAREELFINVEKQLNTLLQERFGSNKSFYLIVNV